MEPADHAASLLAENRLGRGRFAGLPGSCRPADEDGGYAVQDALHGRLAAAGRGELAGWKIGCTTAVMQAYLKIPSPCAGGILAGGVHAAPCAIPYATYVRPGVECEMAVRLGADLPAGGAPYDRARVAAAVEACMAAIEIVDDRYVDWRQIDTPTLIADDFFQAGIVLGPAVSDWRSLDFAAMGGRMAVNGAAVGTGRAADVMGHPFEALAWLANRLARRGRQLRAGDLVMTGSIVETKWLEPGDRVEVAIDGLGEAAVAFTR